MPLIYGISYNFDVSRCNICLTLGVEKVDLHVDANLTVLAWSFGLDFRPNISSADIQELTMTIFWRSNCPQHSGSADLHTGTMAVRQESFLLGKMSLVRTFHASMLSQHLLH